jgi:hypothetical protein
VRRERSEGVLMVVRRVVGYARESEVSEAIDLRLPSVRGQTHTPRCSRAGRSCGRCERGCEVVCGSSWVRGVFVTTVGACLPLWRLPCL